MVYPIRTPSSEAVQNAVFDYLNLNRHKFDQYGNFDLTPDERDLVPLLVGHRAGPPRPINWHGWIQPQRRKLITMAEEDEKLQELHRQMADRDELTPEKCREEWEKEIDRCAERWSGRTRAACNSRAADRLRDCRKNRRYLVKEWGWEDMDIRDIEKEEFRKRFGKADGQKLEEAYGPGVYAPRVVQSESANSEMSGWAKAELLERSTPEAEGPPLSQLEFGEPIRFLAPHAARALRGIRATPGMGFTGGAGGGGKPALVPRFPGDPRVPHKVY